MDIRRDDCTRTARAPAKLNLFLDVLGRRDDGFHELETLMVPIRLSDSVSLTPTPAAADQRPGAILLEVHSSLPLSSPADGDAVPTGRDNLVVRALELFQKRSGCPYGAKVELVKRIPMAAGLGGGSSDAAAALRLANCAWQISWGNDRLAKLAAELGSDAPFFLGHGAATARGRGEQVDERFPCPALHFVVVKPRDGLRTEDVYRAHDALSQPDQQLAPGRLNRFAAELTSGRFEYVWRNMQNSLQEAAASLSPWVRKLRAAFERLDCLAHQLSGSGSAYFGVCRHAQHARRLANTLRARQLGDVYATHSCQ